MMVAVGKVKHAGLAVTWLIEGQHTESYVAFASCVPRYAEVW